jgi:deoxyhypusine monooxygenase
MRMRAAYYLRQAYTEAVTADDSKDDATDDAATAAATLRTEIVAVLCRNLLDTRHGSLLRHELAYIMGQIRDEQSCPTLERVLQSHTDCVMVRHECAEALGAIGAQQSRAILQKVLDENPDTVELAQTCQLALNVMEWRDQGGGGHVDSMPAVCACMLNPYSTVDPAPPHASHANLSIAAIGDILCSPTRPLFERYRAMFSLRNLGGSDAVSQLCRALVHDTSSALLRHEVAYVLGQLQHVDSVDALAQSLRRTDEHGMVRHESAEALGAIDGRWSDVERILHEFANDPDDVIRESCLVALDAADYWGHSQTTEENPAENDAVVPTSESSFAKHKADQRVLVNHFNIKY